LKQKKKGDDPLKTRVIFVACMIHLLIDKCLYDEFLNNSYQRCGNMITHKWKKGGAEHIARMFGVGREDMTYFTFDVTNFDQSAQAHIISLILMLPFVHTPVQDTEAYRVARAFFLQRAHEMAVKIVKWINDEYRLIIGQVFSGLFVTSALDTLYMILCDMVVKMNVYENIEKVLGKKEAKKFQRSFMPSVSYGDDAVRGCEKKWEDWLLKDRTDEYPLGDYQRLSETICGLAFKSTQIGLFRGDDTGVSPFLTIVEPHFEDGVYVRNNILREGPQFLHRYFVRQISPNFGSQIMPWRKEEDYWARVCVSPNSTIIEHPKWRSKFLGLVIDTMGTNTLAFEAMKAMYMISVQLDDYTADRGHCIRNGEVFDPSKYWDTLPRIEHVMEIFEYDETNYDPQSRLTKALAKTGLDRRSTFACLNQFILYREFVWDEKWRNAWAASRGYCLYTDMGEEVVPIWNDIKYSPFAYMEWSDNIEYYYT